jgi:hypothetical protein
MAAGILNMTDMRCHHVHLRSVRRGHALTQGSGSKAAAFPWKEADSLVRLLDKRVAALIPAKPGTDDARELERIISAIEAYEVKRDVVKARLGTG